MDKQKMAHLRNLASKATPGPWWVEKDYYQGEACIAYGIQGDDSETYDLYDSYRVDTDYEYIAAVDPQTVLALLDEIETLNNELENL